MTVVVPAHALTVDTKLENPKLEARAQTLFHELRCVVCQSEAISDSPAQVASDMRKHVRNQIMAGKSDDEIKNYLVAQYGERVLMRPKMNERNALLWFGPLFILIAGGFFAWRSLFRGKV
jgi:cytochrome c-type biogenesis protein CcmH